MVDTKHPHQYEIGQCPIISMIEKLVYINKLKETKVKIKLKKKRFNKKI